MNRDHYRDYKELNLVQYNVNKSRSKVMIALFQEPAIQDIDILAIQEPWRNPYNHQGYNSQDTFYLCETIAQDTRVATYINKAIPQGQWSEVFKHRDLVTIMLRLGERKIYIHNIYLPPQPHTSHNIPETLGTLESLLEYTGEHIVLGDLNLHHPTWNAASYQRSHKLSDHLIDLMIAKA